jgi:hypothetical protein
MVAEVRATSIQPSHRLLLTETSWEQIEDAGAYVEKGSGDLYRIPQEALLKGSSPMIRKESTGANRLIKISGNPFVTTLEARMLCAEHNVTPNF